jgi:hypothetical protein
MSPALPVSQVGNEDGSTLNTAEPLSLTAAARTLEPCLIVGSGFFNPHAAVRTWEFDLPVEHA